MPQRLRPATHHSLRLTAFGAPLAPDDRPVPTPSATQVLLRVHACGVCHSDLHLADGYFDLGGGRRLDMARGMPLPMALGHEGAGEVCAMGEAAEGVAVGGRYVLYPWVGCGQCALCAADEEHLCGAPRHHGVNVDGGFSNFVLVPHPRYLLPMGDLDPAHAATLACSGLTAYSALRKAGPAAAGRPLLIIGAGGVGSAALAVARALGDAPIVADIDPAKRAAALRAGAAEAIDPNDPQARRTLLKQYGGMAAAIDFVGATASADFGLASLRKGGAAGCRGPVRRGAGTGSAAAAHADGRHRRLLRRQPAGNARADGAGPRRQAWPPCRCGAWRCRRCRRRWTTCAPGASSGGPWWHRSRLPERPSFRLRRRTAAQDMVTPLSTGSTTPVITRASSDARNSAA